LQSVLASELAGAQVLVYAQRRSPWTLTVKDVIDHARRRSRSPYNLNGCVELRAGGAEKSDEAGDLRRRAPSAQRAKMTDYRAWFHERRRPPRG
jgi:hypothetical protein